MSRNGFILLMIATVAGIFIGAAIAERYTDPGLGRTLLVGVIAAAIVFPVSWLAERFGWIRGTFDPFAASRNGESRNSSGGDTQ